MKKLATVLLTICLIVPCFSMLTHAADGAIQFVDPNTKVGETLELMGVVKKPNGGNLGALNISITMSYDTTMLKFKSGEGVTETVAGTLSYMGTSTSADGARKEFRMMFDVLKAGTTNLQIKESTIKNASGTVLNYTEGKSTITIAEGEGTVDTPPTTPPTITPGDGATVEIDGVTYTISNEFPESAIPKGYEAATLDYDLETYNVVYNEDSGLYLAYLINEEFLGEFFIYVEEDATFAPYKEIEISDTVTIALLSDKSEVILPEEYAYVELDFDGTNFPAWKNTEHQDYCVVYVINNHGEKLLYQLDTSEGTYQRFIAPEIVVEEVDDSFIGKLSASLEDHLDYVILGTGLGFILFILIIIVLSVKLYNRNAELDEIYDEYGLDLEEDKETEDDIVLDLDNDDFDDYAQEPDTATTDEKAVDAFEDIIKEEIEKVTEVKHENDMKEVFPEETLSNLGEVLANDIVEEQKKDQGEESLGAVLKKTVLFDEDDDDDFENISLDFIDLDD